MVGGGSKWAEEGPEAAFCHGETLAVPWKMTWKQGEYVGEENPQEEVVTLQTGHHEGLTLGLNREKAVDLRDFSALTFFGG